VRVLLPQPGSRDDGYRRRTHRRRYGHGRRRNMDGRAGGTGSDAARARESGTRMIGRRFREWVRREVRTIIEAEQRKIRIYYDDPMREYEENRESIATQLAAAANVVGRNVMCGRDVVIAGGRFPGGVGLELHDFVRVYDHCRLMIDQASPAS